MVSLKTVSGCMMQLMAEKEIDLIRLTIPAFKMTFYDILTENHCYKEVTRSLLTYFETTLNGWIMNRNYFRMGQVSLTTYFDS